VKTWTRILRRVFIWFAGRWRNHQPKQAEKPHSKSSGRKALDGPATRPDTPLAVENSVGKLAANLAPNVGTGKRVWRTQPGRRPNPKKPTALRGAVGVRDCESSDHIKPIQASAVAEPQYNGYRRPSTDAAASRSELKSLTQNPCVAKRRTALLRGR
jgi:hypothetical protein